MNTNFYLILWTSTRVLPGNNAIKLSESCELPIYEYYIIDTIKRVVAIKDRVAEYKIYVFRKAYLF